jgi:1-acyl-sn-glycerol-3-phosphate acyltransferase
MSNGSSKRSSASGRRRRSNAPSDGSGPNGHDPEEAGERIAGALGAPRLDLASAAKGLSGLAARALSAVADEALARVPRADLDERDPDYIREQLPGLWLLASLYFRAEVRGLHHIPEEGPVLLVGNHSGGNLTPDTGVFTLAFNTYFGVERRFYQLAHNLVLTMPGLARLRKFGTVAANPENANAALDRGAALLVYPGGDYEVHRPSWETAKVNFGGRKGFIRLALEKDVPIVPVVSVGGQETALFLSRGERLAKLLRLDRMFRLKVLPISLALPWGINIGDMLGHLPLPAKITIEVLPPIHLREEFGEEPDLDEAYDEIVGRMQDSLTALQSERTLPLIG